MNALLTTNWKRAQELSAERGKLDTDLVALQEELRHLSTTVNKKIAAKEAVVAELLRLQESTAQLVTSGKWVQKDGPLPQVLTSGSVPVIASSLDVNPIWNYIKKVVVSAWNFLFNRKSTKVEKNVVFD